MMINVQILYYHQLCLFGFFMFIIAIINVQILYDQMLYWLDLFI